MTGLIGFVIAVALLRYLFRLAGGRSNQVRIRIRIPLRTRYPRVWWSLTTIGLLVAVVAVGCGS